MTCAVTDGGDDGAVTTAGPPGCGIEPVGSGGIGAVGGCAGADGVGARYRKGDHMKKRLSEKCMLL